MSELLTAPGGYVTLNAAANTTTVTIPDTAHFPVGTRLELDPSSCALRVIEPGEQDPATSPLALVLADRLEEAARALRRGFDITGKLRTIMDESYPLTNRMLSCPSCQRTFCSVLTHAHSTIKVLCMGCMREGR